MKVWKVGPQGHGLPPQSLGQQDFVAKGGQASVYAVGDTAYKIYEDPALAMSSAKLAELSVLSDPRIVRPRALLADQKGKVVGYEMRYLQQCFALCQLFPRSFRERKGVSAATSLALVHQLRELVEHAHGARVLVVDLNEMNVLVARDFSELYLIDVDSFQTRSFAATAIMDSVRDRQVVGNAFHEGSDWFSFAVLAFQLLVGIHPYKGKHPSVSGLDARMSANLSAFHREVSLPGAAYPLDIIPPGLRAWMEAVLERGERSAPPNHRGVQVVEPVPVVIPAGSGALRERVLHSFASKVVGTWVHRGVRVTATEDALWVGTHRRLEKPEGFAGIAFSQRSAKPVAVSCKRDELSLVDLDTGKVVPFGLHGSQLAFHDGRAYLLSGDSLVELLLTEAGAQLVASGTVIAKVMRHASKLFEGVVVQDLLGSCFVSLLTGPGENHQRRLPELDGHQIVSARFHRGVLLVVGRPRGAQRHRLDRFVVRFGAAMDGYDVRVDEDVASADIEMVVLERGVCIRQGDDGALELFHRDPGSSEIKVLRDDLLDGGWTLSSDGASLQAARGACLYELRMS